MENISAEQFFSESVYELEEILIWINEMLNNVWTWNYYSAKQDQRVYFINKRKPDWLWYNDYTF